MITYRIRYKNLKNNNIGLMPCFSYENALSASKRMKNSSKEFIDIEKFDSDSKEWTKVA